MTSVKFVERDESELMEVLNMPKCGSSQFF